MRQVPAIAGLQFGAFTRTQALAAGWTPDALRHAIGGGDLERLRAGVYAAPHQDSGNRWADDEQRLRRSAAAIGLSHRRLTISHSAAAALTSLPLIATPRTPCVTYARPFRGEIPGAHLHRARLFPGHVSRIGRLLVTSPARTIVDLAREHGADAAIGAADDAVRRGIVSPRDLDAVTAACAGWPGVCAARRVIAELDPASESVLESVSRLRMLDFELPRPQTQARIFVGGRFLGRVDFYWDEFGVFGEADGMAKYDGTPLSLTDEKRRQGELEDAGLIAVRWGWSELWPFDAVAHRLRAAFARGLRPDRAPRLWTVRLGTPFAVSVDHCSAPNGVTSRG